MSLMAMALTIKALALLGVIVILALVPSPASWILAAGILGVTAAVFGWTIGRVNSSTWTRTLWRSTEPARANGPVAALTFDDGPDESFTPRILEILAEKAVPATFFVVGERVRRHPEVVRLAWQMGHAIGNHTETHSLRFHFRNGAGMRREVDACNDAIRAAIGLEPCLFRPPQGVSTPALGDALSGREMTVIGWQVRGMDYVIRDPKRIARRIVEGAADGGVILLHDGGGLQGSVDRSATIQALPRVIDGLRERGFTFVRVDRLFGVPAYRTERETPAASGVAARLAGPGSPAGAHR
jgi:peptidoglycan-N-acetylglucosamine deacetylase